jgi:hypothetical protein
MEIHNDEATRADAGRDWIPSRSPAACDKGPMQKAGEKIDRATDQDKLIGKGPLEKAGKNVDSAVKDLKK